MAVIRETGLAVSCFVYNDEVVAAIRCYIPAYRSNARQRQRVLDALRLGAAVIERQMNAVELPSE